MTSKKKTQKQFAKEPLYPLLEQRSRGILASAFAELAFAPHPWEEPEWERVFFAVNRVTSLFCQFERSRRKKDTEPMPSVALHWSYGDGTLEGSVGDADNGGRSWVDRNPMVKCEVKLSRLHMVEERVSNLPLTVGVFATKESTPERSLTRFLEPELRWQLELLRTHKMLAARENAGSEPPRDEEKLWDLRVRFTDFLRRFLRLHRSPGKVEHGYAGPFDVFFLGSRASTSGALSTSHVRSGLFGHSYLLDAGQKEWLLTKGSSEQRAFLESGKLEQEYVEFPEGLCSAAFIAAGPTAPAKTDEILTTYGRTPTEFMKFEQSIIGHSLLEIPIYQDLGMTTRRLASDGPSLIMCVNLPEGSDESKAGSGGLLSNTQDESSTERLSRLLASPAGSGYEDGEAQFVTETGQRLAHEYLRAGALRRSSRSDVIAPSIIGDSDVIKQLRRGIARMAATDMTVLVLGESGTGKELVARALHDHSNRRDGPFLSVNCSTIPSSLADSELFGHKKGSFNDAEARDGFFKSANGGTLFLDEFADLPLNQQTKILRALESSEIRGVGYDTSFEVDVRVICATNKDVRALVDEGALREDLFYRVDQLSIAIPALRDRGSDIDVLARHFLDEASRLHGVAKRISMHASFLDRLRAHQWPGNVRELKNIIDKAVVLHCADGREDELRAEHFPDDQRTGQERRQAKSGRGRLEALEGTYRIFLERVEDSDQEPDGRP